MAHEAAEMIHEHPDANLLAAFTERRLPAPERQDLLAHLAKCAECRDIVALTSAPAPAARARSIPLAWRWAAGFAAAALVLTGAWGLRLILWSPPAPHSAPVVAMARRIDSAPGPPPVAAIASQPEIAPAPKLASRARHEKGAPGVVPRKQFTGAMPANPAATPLAKSRESFAINGFLSRPRVLWSVADHSLVQSLDGGTSWHPISFGKNAEFNAVASRGSDVWAGGSHAVLFHSSDAGASWREIEVGAEGTKLTGTILAIRLPEALEVILETDSDQQWISRDGGMSWRRL